MSNRGVILLILAAAAIAAVAGLLVGRQVASPARDTAPVTQAALMYPQPRPIAPFTLERDDGTPFTADALKGHWSLLFFGFTHCPDVCPVTLSVMKQVETQLAQRSPPPAAPAMVFVSVDPARDRGAVMGDYAHYFSPSIIAVTGDDAALRDLTGRLGIVYMKTPLDGGDYTVDHSAQLLIVDPQGRLAGMFRPPLDAARIADDLVALAGSPQP